MMDLEERLARLEADNTVLRGHVNALRQDAVTRGRRDALSPADINALLAPRGLVAPIGSRSGVDTTPDLASPLMARLRDDASHPSAAVGSYEGGYPNLLLDPLLENLPATGTLTTVWSSLGATTTRWLARYVQNSGAAPTTAELYQTAARQTTPLGYEHSARGYINVAFAAAGDITVQFIAYDAWSPLSTFLPSWLTASAWFAGSATATVTVKVQIVDSAGGTVLAESDPMAFNSLGDIEDAAPVFAAFESPVMLDPY